MAYVNGEYILQSARTLANGLTAEPLTDGIPCKAGNSPLVVDVKVTSGTGTIKLQDSSNGFTTANTKAKTVSVTGAGTFSITLMADIAGDQANYPLRNVIRLVMDTTSIVVIEEVRVCIEK